MMSIFFFRASGGNQPTGVRSGILIPPWFKEDWLEVDRECPDCGYITCESCTCHNSRGTCYCPSSNFGYAYCKSEPRSYHFCGRNGKRYSGDYHPDAGHELNREDHPEAFEKKTRACNNCGKIVHCLLKKGYRSEWF